MYWSAPSQWKLHSLKNYQIDLQRNTDPAKFLNFSLFIKAIFLYILSIIA